MTNNLKPGERLDDLQIKGYEIIQSLVEPGKNVPMSKILIHTRDI